MFNDLPDPILLEKTLYEPSYDISLWFFLKFSDEKVIVSLRYIQLRTNIYEGYFRWVVSICILTLSSYYLFLIFKKGVFKRLFSEWHTIHFLGLTFLLFKFRNVDPIRYFYDICLGRCMCSLLINCNYLNSMSMTCNPSMYEFILLFCVYLTRIPHILPLTGPIFLII